jgi:hypothetical protein
MKVDVKNVFNDVFWAVILKELCDVEGPLANIVPFTKLYYGVHFPIYYQHGRHVDAITIIESYLNTK